PGRAAGSLWNLRDRASGILSMRPCNRALALVLLAAGCARAHPAVAAPAPDPPLRPNLILVVTDDMAAEDLDHLPRIKSLLVDRGATFTRAFVTDSVCTPSRASILTGRYPHNHG